MIESFRLLRHISIFNNVDTGIQLPLGAFALIYAENGRGKTTLAVVLRSLDNGDPLPILERKRLGSADPPHIVIARTDGAMAVFQDGAWMNRFADIAVFDDFFIADNVCSGLVVETTHRQKLHELIIGTQGVALSDVLQGHVDRIEQHIRELHAKGNAIPEAVRAGMDADQFCALEARDDIDAAIQATERSLAAANQYDAIKQQVPFTPITLPVFDLGAVALTLKRGLPELETEAATRVKEHFAMIGDNGENWIAEGMSRIDLDLHRNSNQKTICSCIQY